MTFRGLIGACVLLTAPAAAFGQKPTAAKQPVAADSAAAQPAENSGGRIVVFRDSVVLIHCDTPPLFREGHPNIPRVYVTALTFLSLLPLIPPKHPLLLLISLPFLFLYLP